MLPVVAIVGRPNVGKSTLFNELTRSREALVLDMPGVTRDRLYGSGKIGDRPFIVIDTGGLQTEDETFDTLITDQSWQAVQEADVVLFLVDARAGLTTTDRFIAQKLRETKKPVNLIVNKTDGLDPAIAVADFFAIGLGEPTPIAASHGRGILVMMETALKPFPPSEASEIDAAEAGIKIAIVGRPNVGKSTLVNRMLGEERVIAFDEPGTTRDSIYIPLERQGQKYTIIDTAGVRRKSRVSETIEKFSVVKTLKAIEDCHVVILVCDAEANISEQDLSLLGFVLEAGRALVLAINKWDGLENRHKTEVKQKLTYRLAFADFAKVHFISALHGTGVGNLFDSVKKAYLSSNKILPTSELTRVLQVCIAEHAPPMINARRIKLRYAHAGGHNPPTIIIHGNQTEHVPKSYTRYLMNAFRKKLRLEGTPIRIEYKTSENPYKDKINKLTPLQKYKQKRQKHR